MYFQQPLRAQLEKMKSFIEFLMLSCLVTALAHTLRKPAKSNDGLKEKRSDMNNYYYAGGQNCNKTEQQLARIIEMLEEIRSSPPQNKNETGVTGPPKGLYIQSLLATLCKIDESNKFYYCFSPHDLDYVFDQLHK